MVHSTIAHFCISRITGAGVVHPHYRNCLCSGDCGEQKGRRMKMPMESEERYCNKCGNFVVKETNKKLKKEYPYYCKICYENMYKFETHTK